MENLKEYAKSRDYGDLKIPGTNIKVGSLSSTTSLKQALKDLGGSEPPLYNVPSLETDLPVAEPHRGMGATQSTSANSDPPEPDYLLHGENRKLLKDALGQAILDKLNEQAKEMVSLLDDIKKSQARNEEEFANAEEFGFTRPPTTGGGPKSN